MELDAKFSPFKNKRYLQLLELEIGRHIAWDDTNNRAKGFDSIMLQSAVMYYDIIFYGTLSYLLPCGQTEPKGSILGNFRFITVFHRAVFKRLKRF